ncbi:MAG TPA: retropepsin-like aspartic protease [Terracidiphilus sp.]|nr:retropepsin-like aspartic protease [Terracidiphilus sp.]
MTTFRWIASLVPTLTIVVPLLAESHCPGNAASLSFRLVNGYQIVVPVSINHSGPYDFLLDTGTQMTILAPSLADELHLNAEGAAVVEGAGFQQSASPAKLELLEAGSYAVSNQKALVYRLLNLRSVDSRIRGILGEDFLEHFDVLIDHAHKRLCLDDSGSMGARIKGLHIPLVTPAQAENEATLPRLLIIEARLSGETGPVRLMLDSGANIPYLYNTSQRLAPQATSFGGRSLVGSGADGDHKVFSALPPQKVKIGSLELPEITFLTLAYPRKKSSTSKFDGLLTMNLFRAVFISYSGQFVVLEPR